MKKTFSYHFLFLINIFLISIFLLTNCNGKNESKSVVSNNTDIAQEPKKLLPRTQINILELEKKGAFKDTVTVEVGYDPVFFRKKTYKGISLKNLLMENLDLQNVDTTQTKLFFECDDKYIVTMRLGQALHHKGYLVFKDVEAPQGKRFMPAYKGDELKELDPFYIVWENTPKGDMSFVWPYNLTKIKMK